MTYMTKNTPVEDLLKEIARLRNQIDQLKHHAKKNTEKRSKIRADWKTRYNKLKYKLFKKDQLVYGKNLHIQRIKAKNMRSSKVWRREGYNHAMKRIVVNHYKVKHLASFLFKTSTVMEIYKLDMREYSFILWAGRYDFFDRKDFNNTVGDIDVSFYRMVNKLMKRGLVDFVAKKTGEARKIFSLTGTGVDLYNRVAKFTNKSLRSDTE
jgi:DNA-binding PadR family transcriptional regulator